MRSENGSVAGVTVPPNGTTDIVVTFDKAFVDLPAVSCSTSGSGSNVIATIKTIHNNDAHIRINNLTTVEQTNRGFQWVAVGK